MLFFNRARRIPILRDLVEEEGEEGEEEEEEVHAIASALAISGLSDKAMKALYPLHSRKYWSEADLLASEAISSGDEETKTKILAALSILVKNDDMVPSSRAIIMCNIARILAVSGNKKEAIDALKIGLIYSERTLNERLKVDPILQNYAEELES